MKHQYLLKQNLTKSTKIDKKHERRTKEENACLLDVIDVSLFDVEILSAKWFEGRGDPENDFVFSNFTLKRQVHKCKFIISSCISAPLYIKKYYFTRIIRF